MTAALLRGGRGVCVQCFHRELCRLIWRPQTALFSSKPSDPRKQPRITHIKKAKPQPAVDIPKLLEELFSQRRPHPAPPAGKASTAKPSSTKPSAISSVKTTASTFSHSPPTAASTSKQAEDVYNKTTPPASPPPDTLPASQKPVSSPGPVSPAADSTKISSSFEAPPQSSPPFIKASTAGVVSEMMSPATTTSVPSPATTTPASVEPQAPSIESLSASTIEAKVETSVDSGELPSATSANTVESSTEMSEFTAESTIEPTVDALSSPMETLESRAVFVEGTVDPVIEATVDTVAQEVQLNNTDSGADAVAQTVLIETTVETTATPLQNKGEVSALSSGVVAGLGAKEGEEKVGGETAQEPLNVAETMTLESVTLAEARSLVESLPFEDLLQTKAALEDKAEAVIQDSLVQTGNGAECETAAETFAEVLSERDSLSEDVEALEAETDVLMEQLLCTIPEAVSKMPASVKTSLASHATSSGVAMEASGESMQKAAQVGEEEVTEVEAMTLESITLAEVEARVASLETDVLQQAKTVLEKEAEILAREERMEERTVIEDGTMSEVMIEADVLTLDSLSEATDALETETSVVLEAMLCSGVVPTPPPDSQPGSPSTARAETEALFGYVEVESEKLNSQEAAGVSVIGGEEAGEQEVNVVEAMTLESVTLAEVEALVGTLDSVALTATTTQLEQEAEMLAKEERMGEQRMVLEDSSLSEEVAEALSVEALSLPEADSLPEALQAETDILMEQLLFSIPGPVGVTSEDLIVQGVAREDILDGYARESSVCEEERGSEELVLNEALTLESLTLSEVETLVETSEMDVLTQTDSQEEAEAKEEAQAEQKVFSEDAEADIPSEAEILTKADVLAEAADALEAESAVILQNLLCPVSGIVTADTTGSAAVNTAPTEPDTLPLSPPAREEVLGQEEEDAGSPPAASEEVETEGGTQTEALGTHEGLDPVQLLFLEKIREYNNKRRLCDGAVEAGPDFEKRLSEETAKLQRLYGGGDLSSFPQFTFTEPELHQDSK
ncbi:cell wall protein DAN4-like [Myripristis murdjan]|uniref:ATP synthase peripheral stalk subunit F6, mitochondrial n=1 Tax=Myripristis murdjan TaxID=586833 RepID=A0A667XJC7_9TELE|nr:cell wall protein DAN4-like [Myripristis murdjan]